MRKLVGMAVLLAALCAFIYAGNQWLGFQPPCP